MALCRDENPVSLDTHGIGGNVLTGWSPQHTPAANVELRQMDRTGQRAAGQFAVTERAADVRAVVADSIDVARDVDETDERTRLV